MRAITEKTKNIGQNAWGQDSISDKQDFVIEAGDVGVTRQNYRGHGHSSYTFRASDVGRTITVYTETVQGPWTCWVFSSQEVTRATR